MASLQPGTGWGAPVILATAHTIDNAHWVSSTGQPGLLGLAYDTDQASRTYSGKVYYQHCDLAAAWANNSDCTDPANWSTLTDAAQAPDTLVEFSYGAMDAAGNAHAGWEDYRTHQHPSDWYSDVYYNKQALGSETWPTPVNLSAGDHIYDGSTVLSYPYEPVVAALSAEDVYVGWYEVIWNIPPGPNDYRYEYHFTHWDGTQWSTLIHTP